MKYQVKYHYSQGILKSNICIYDYHITWATWKIFRGMPYYINELNK